MSELYLLAPGPGASAEIAENIRSTGKPCGVITSAWTLAPWADFLASADLAWWKKYPEALSFTGRKFSANRVHGVEYIRMPATWNSGCLGLECAKNLGATRIYLFGFDMHGTHFFGPYKNGLKNTEPKRRVIHLAQYAEWKRRNKKIEVLNCTPGSALSCFEFHEIRF